MDDVLVIGGGPAGLFSAWLARQRGAKVRVVAAGIGTTHIMPGWLGVLGRDGDRTSALEELTLGRPAHPYALAGLQALEDGMVALQALCEPLGLRFSGKPGQNMRFPTALGASIDAAFAPESFVAGDGNLPGRMLIAGPAGWRDFYPDLCASNLARQGVPAQGLGFDLPEIHAVKFDSISTGLARLFDRPEVRERVGRQIRAHLNGASRVGLPAVVGLNDYPRAWQHLQDVIGAPVFEIPTLPPSVPGIRLYNILKSALARAGVQVLLNMPVERALIDGDRVVGVAVKSVVRETVYRARYVVLATGGLYGGGILSDHHGELREPVFALPLTAIPPMSEWFGGTLLTSDHPIHYAGVMTDSEMRPLDERGQIIYENLRVAGRILAGYNGAREGSTEGVWIATAYAAIASLFR
jgi:glycerol-3-phosphate dehydrogenase subunit B